MLFVVAFFISKLTFSKNSFIYTMRVSNCLGPDPDCNGHEKTALAGKALNKGHNSPVRLAVSFVV